MVDSLNIINTVNVWDKSRLLTAKKVGYSNGGGGVRGKIKEFSSQSRWRLIKDLNKIDKSVSPLFVTLTYPGNWENSDCKKDLELFRKRFLYRFKNAGYYWKLEFQKRGAPHFHLLVYGVKYAHLIRWLSNTWYEVVGSGDIKHLRAGTRVEKKKKQFMIGYLCKYITKQDLENFNNAIKEETYKNSFGRFWGKTRFINSLIPMPKKIIVGYKTFYDLKRIMRKKANTKNKVGFLLSESPGQYIKLILILSENRLEKVNWGIDNIPGACYNNHILEKG